LCKNKRLLTQEEAAKFLASVELRATTAYFFLLKKIKHLFSITTYPVVDFINA
jgi:hypothetical protein